MARRSSSYVAVLSFLGVLLASCDGVPGRETGKPDTVIGSLGYLSRYIDHEGISVGGVSLGTGSIGCACPPGASACLCGGPLTVHTLDASGQRRPFEGPVVGHVVMESEIEGLPDLVGGPLTHQFPASHVASTVSASDGSFVLPLPHDMVSALSQSGRRLALYSPLNEDLEIEVPRTQAPRSVCVTPEGGSYFKWLNAFVQSSGPEGPGG